MTEPFDTDEPDYDDDWYDDDLLGPKEEPDCFACNDAGCRSCQPTRLQYWWWRWSRRIRDWLHQRRHRQQSPDEGPPF